MRVRRAAPQRNNLETQWHLLPKPGSMMEKWDLMIHELGHALSRRSGLAHGEVWGEAVGESKRDDRGKTHANAHARIAYNSKI